MKGVRQFGEKEIEGFWKVVKEKELEKKEMPIVVAMTQKRQTARREGNSGFWTRERYSKRIPRCFSGEETLRRGYCYKTRVWTDFGQGQDQPDINRQIIISLQWRKST